MGYPRKAESAPSPIEMLAIFSAKESGMPLHEISRRTKHSVSSITRWWEKWGRETAIYEEISMENPDVGQRIKFEALFPEAQRQGTFDLGEGAPGTAPPSLGQPELKGDEDNL